MTNTLNTPVEALEAYYPLRVRHYRRRRGSGGRGLHRGGDGIDRALEVLEPTELTLLAERRSTRPYGLAGGEPGKPGRDEIIRSGKRKALAAKANVELKPGDLVRVRTPGGGGWGKKG
jgi:N-methylhydantoinase B